jgi:hypothetical protein
MPTSRADTETVQAARPVKAKTVFRIEVVRLNLWLNQARVVGGMMSLSAEMRSARDSFIGS